MEAEVITTQSSDEKVEPVLAEDLASAYDIGDEYKTIEWHGISVIVRSFISFRETMQFVNSVMESLYCKDADMLVPEMKDFAIRSNIVLRYTNALLPADLEEQYKFLYCTDFVDSVISVINGDQYQSILDAIHFLMVRQYKE